MQPGKGESGAEADISHGNLLASGSTFDPIFCAGFGSRSENPCISYATPAPINRNCTTRAEAATNKVGR